MLPGGPGRALAGGCPGARPARMIKSRVMMSDDATRTPAAAGNGASAASGTGATGAAGNGASGAAAHAAPRPRPRRNLNLADRLLRVPIGFLWLGVLAIVAVPVLIYMTLLYWAVQGTSSLFGRSRARRADGTPREERVA